MGRRHRWGWTALAGVVVLALVSCSGGGPGGSTTPAGCGGPLRTSIQVLGSDAYQLFNTSVIAATDCSFLTAGYALSAADKHTDLVLTKSGRTPWAKAYASDRDRNSIVPAAPGPASGMSEPGGQFPWVSATPADNGGAAVVIDSVLMRIDVDGGSAWAKEYRTVRQGGPSPSVDLSFSAVVRMGDGFVVLARNADKVAVLLRLDGSGSVVWAKRYEGLYAEANSPLLVTPDGGVLLGGYINTRDAPQGVVAKVILDGTSKDGTLAWARSAQAQAKLRADLPETWASSGFHTIGLAGNGDVLLAQSFGRANDSQMTMITRLTPDGGLAWSELLGWTVARGLVDTWITQIVADGDGLLLTGSSTGFEYPAHGNNANFNAYVARLNSDGTPDWIRSLGKVAPSGGYRGDRSYDYGTSLLLTTDRNLVVTGYSDSFSNPPGAPQEPWHFDGLLAVADARGLVATSAGLLNSADVADPEEVFTRSVDTVLSERFPLPEALDIAAQEVTYTTSDAGLTARTLPSEDPTLRLTYDGNSKELASNLSMFDVAQAGSDPDADGLRQDWEDEAIRLLNPVFVVDEEEDWLNNRAKHHVASLVRAAPWPSDADPRFVLLYFAVTWTMDYGGYVSSGPFSGMAVEAHRGDVERVVLALRVTGDRRARLEWVVTSAHGAENTHSGVWHVKDRTCNAARIKGYAGGSDGTEVMCDNLQFNGDGQLVLQTSEDKHAIYPSKDLCESVKLVNWPVGSYGEDCGWEPSTIPLYDLAQWKESDFQGVRGHLGHGHWQFDAYNVGEPNSRLVDDLDRPPTWQGLTTTQVDALTGVFPVERVWWGGERFCGGIQPLDAYWSSSNLLPQPTPEDCVDHLPASSLDSEWRSPETAFDVTALLKERIQSRYRVSITTANVAGAGTDAAVTVSLMNDLNFVQATVPGSFEAGDTDVVHLGSDVGAPTSTILSRDNVTDNASWLITKIVVERKQTQDRWTWTVPAEVKSLEVGTAGVTLPLQRVAS